jgi:acid phosphatase (class A)
MGSGWLGSGWHGSGWHGSGWQGSGWAGGGGAAGMFAMRDDKPFADFKITPPLNFAVAYPEGQWDPDLSALRILPEFFSIKNTAGNDWKTRIGKVKDWKTFSNADIQREIDQLLILAVTERPTALGEIIQQNQNFQIGWLHLLMIDQGSHPLTFRLMKLAARVGEAVMIHYKYHFKRPRPSQICPTLFQPVEVPGHAAYPAGHALIAYLTTNCLIDMLPNTNKSKPVLKLVLEKFAERLAFNRCIAGLHYPSDNEAGKAIAEKMVPILRDCPTYDETFKLAQKEWK